MAEHGFMGLLDAQSVEQQSLGLVTVDNPHLALQFGRVVMKGVFKRVSTVSLQMNDGKHIVRDINADAE